MKWVTNTRKRKGSIAAEVVRGLLRKKKKESEKENENETDLNTVIINDIIRIGEERNVLKKKVPPI